jgi:hypothetical protein
MLSIKEYITEGITIERTDIGYRVFTRNTSYFNIKDLDELTPERFEKELDLENDCRKMEEELFGEYFKDLFE